MSVCVQHHPDRAHLVEALAERLGGAEVVTDPEPDSIYRSPFRTYAEALRRTPADATHRLVVQDDAAPCDNFRPLMLERLAEHPESLVAFFVPGAPPHRAAVIRATAAGQTWVTLPPSWIPAVALCWPVDVARQFLTWADERYEGTKRQGDDGPIGWWASRSRIRAMAPIPSLVEHPDVEPSLIGRRAYAGANRARVAASFIGNAAS